MSESENNHSEKLDEDLDDLHLTVKEAAKYVNIKPIFGTSETRGKDQ